MSILFETFDVCGKTFMVIPGYSVIFIPLLLAIIFTIIARGLSRFLPLIPAFIFIVIALFFFFYKNHLAEKVTKTLLADPQCVDAAFMMKTRLFPHYSTSVYLDPKDIPNDSILKYQGENKTVLDELAERYELGLNGVEKNIDRANEIKLKFKSGKPQ